MQSRRSRGPKKIMADERILSAFVDLGEWTIHTISRGTKYYYNTQTNVLVWDLDDEEAEQSGDWEFQRAAHEKTYFHNTTTNEVTWKMPTELTEQRAKHGDKFQETLQKFKRLGESHVESLPALDVQKHVDLQNIKTYKKQLIRELKGKYKRLFDAVLPIPFFREKLFGLEEVFVEGIIEIKAMEWRKLDSYHDVFKDVRMKGRNQFLLGEPGYGKSTLSLKYAHNWCCRIQGSYLEDVEILILIKLEKIEGVYSIFTAIKEFLLPKNSCLREKDIEMALKNSHSVVVILDSLEEYSDDGNPQTDIMKIIEEKMFQDFEVLLTSRHSRHSPSILKTGAKWLRLTGFDAQAQDEYIKKAVVASDDVAATRIKELLNESPILENLCQVPLLFAMFAHMTHDDKTDVTFNTVSSFFRYIIKCLYSHMRNKKGDLYSASEENHQKLDQLAFECICGKTQKKILRRGELRKRLGVADYDEYVKLGILVEEEDFEHVNHEDIEVRFCNRYFCEWYAAHYLEHCASVLRINELKEKLRLLDPCDFQYCYRFACGIKRNTAEIIIQCLKERAGIDRFPTLCAIEQLGGIQQSLNCVENVCSYKIELTKDHNILQQRSVVELLNIASIYNIPVSPVFLIDCHCVIDPSCSFIQLESNLDLPVIATLTELTIQESGRNIGLAELEKFFRYLSKCESLTQVTFAECLLPWNLGGDSYDTLRSRGVTVNWIFKGGTCWMNRGINGLESRSTPKTKTDYQERVNLFHETYPPTLVKSNANYFDGAMK